MKDSPDTAIQRVAAATGANATQVSTTVTYGYDSAGKLTSILYPSGRKLSITYTDGLPSAVGLAKDSASAATALVSQILWQPFGGVTSWQWQMASGTQLHERLYDAYGRVLRYRLGNTVRDLSYDAGDRIAAYTHHDAGTAAATPALDQGFAYDELGRLTSVSAGGSNWLIAYDANGNRASVTLNDTARAYTTAATSNRLAALDNPVRSMAHDAMGNRTSDQALYASGYDLAGRLATLNRSGWVNTFSVDGLGRRVRKFSSSGVASTVIFVYDQSGQLLGEYDSSGAPLREYVWLGATSLAMFVPNGTNPPLVYYFHTDHLGTPQAVLDIAGNLRWTWFTEPFGTTAPNTNPQSLGAFTQNLRLPGQYFDAETSLFYNGWRDYDSSTGRYVQSDPIGLAGGINTYSHVENQPTKYTDPLGLETYICTRPLDGSPGSYAPPLLNHTYVCVGSGANMTCGSTTASSGGALRNILPGSPGKPTTPATDYFKPEACERRQGEDSCIETCIANELKKPTRPRYAIGPAGTDCQEYAEDVVSTCERRCVRR